jgi:hypothetical protein
MTGSQDLEERFRIELESEMERRWLASPLADWMDAHHAFAAEMLTDAKMDWEQAAAAFATAGLRDGHGHPPTADVTCETWQRVEARRRVAVQLRQRKG